MPMPGTAGGSITSAKASLIVNISRRRSARMPCVVSPAFCALAERLQRHEDDAGIGRNGEGRAVETGEADRMGDAGARQHDVGRACRTTSSVRGSEEPGGSCRTAMK